MTAKITLVDIKFTTVGHHALRHDGYLVRKRVGSINIKVVFSLCISRAYS